MSKMSMNRLSIVTFVIAFMIVLIISGPIVNLFAQTPTASDLPTTIGDDSSSDMTLTNNSLPVENMSNIAIAPRF
ncbi:MAG TPA: hypothetical protein VJR94_00885 [Candidatus Nitrosocosmicus sp.]|nr:hypothetical protein [Candidatus Nitrosocosmicus sp.]